MPRDTESELLLFSLKELDSSDNEVTAWESSFIESVLDGKYDGPLSERQKMVIYEMCEKYGIQT